ncbi:flagellar basal body rod protein FlgC [Geminicoccus flavidas]|uniref:flagellar basal body rod protein FlgC n=1 Tax=Geminicoccus flavidas TaxID=2506407 RepID=UPI00135A3089|nr:flagellar basal body rod protein FlgC [Geminicoccus flavidas]
MDLESSLAIAGAGMKVQSSRMRVTAENLANADSTATRPGGEPYRRKTISFGEVYDRAQQQDLVQVRRYGTDPSAFRTEYRPGHPAADAEGYVQLPNVQPLVEMMDMREAQRSYEANLNAFEVSKKMLQRTIDLLR